MDPASILMAEGERWPPRELARLELVHQVDVGVARTSPADSDDHLSGTSYRIGDLDQDRVGLPFHQPHRLHGLLLSVTPAH